MKTVLMTTLMTTTVLLTACDSYLTDDPKSQITPEQAYNSVNSLKKNALLTIYNYIGGHASSQGLQGTDKGVYDMNSFTTDEQIIPVRGGDWYDGGIWLRLFSHKWTEGEGPFMDTWNYLYKVVMLCNEGIERIAAYKTNDIDEIVKLDAYNAELRALRAMYYYYLMDLFGRVPLVTTTDIKSSELTLCDRQTLFYWIYQELNDALPLLPLQWSQHNTNEYYGRMTIFVAYFIMMKMAINAEIYTDNNWTDNVWPDGRSIMLKTTQYFTTESNTSNAWETVKFIYNTVKDYYGLAENYFINFQVDNEVSPENIFIIPINPMLYANKNNYFERSRHYCHGAALGGKGDNGPCATVSTMKTFGYTGKEGQKTDGRFSANFFDGPVFINGREVYLDDGVTPLIYQPLAVTRVDLSGNEYEKTAGARIAKYNIEAEFKDERMEHNDIVLFRFADMVMMYAEALYRLGDNTEALKALNEVHTRTNDKKLERIDDDVLLDERLMELMWEGWRRNDLIRFHRFNKKYDLKIDTAFEADGHTIVFPIPADMLVMHPDWEQNPGY